MNPYSQDLRERVIAAVKSGKKSQAEVAETFGMSLSTVEKWWRRWRETKSNAVLPRQSGPKRTLAECDDLIRAEVRQQPDVTLDELCTRVAETRKVSASRSMMCRTLQVLGLPRKKVAPRQSAGDAASESLAAEFHRRQGPDPEDSGEKAEIHR